MTPALSIVMVSHGALGWTERALAAVAEHTRAVHEVIVVDNASTDGTPQRLRELPVRLIENAENRGFGPASNEGAEAARAPVLVFLNTDALVEAGWDQPLLDAVATPGVAAAVPLVLELDGRIQCAGALLGRDGTVIEHGNGADPRDPAYRFPRAVDFGPGACLAVRAEAFRAAGGFDAAYAPAYYEDADLCLALAGRTLYVPAATIRHAKKASGGNELAQQLSDRHRAFFAARWHERLAGRPSTLARPTPPLLLAARDAPADGRVLVRDPAVLDALLAARPFARVSLVGGDETWLARGVELIDEHAAAARAHHYDVELSAPPRDLARALAAGGLV
ncbi:GT2 family glycosyltransferase [Solirubrobacter pauli]|uniref:GT2 family glycosyltransferase n=1 Tax=Solirubrobacter pauli TaxID=166793 RepID=A0A660LIV8_9ACTN|nr:glycosyltransferase family 2 protein [Solirubrobacter pauli]RKQ92891.1 GT2 family glycosyltransferase [Solirubrobacter pauli]